MTLIDSTAVAVIGLPRGPLTLTAWSKLDPGDTGYRFELVDGGLLAMPPAKPNHAVVVIQLVNWLISSGVEPRRVLVDVGVATGDSSGRVPDLVLLHEPLPDEFAPSYLTPAMVQVVVEVVSPSTATQDRQIKPVEYARAGIEWYWRVEGAGGPSAGVLVDRYRTSHEPLTMVYGTLTLAELLASDPADL